MYISDNKILVRITVQEENGDVKTVLNFKDDNDSGYILKVSRETIPFVVNNENKEAIMSMFTIFGYKVKKK